MFFWAGKSESKPPREETSGNNWWSWAPMSRAGPGGGGERGAGWRRRRPWTGTSETSAVLCLHWTLLCGLKLSQSSVVWSQRVCRLSRSICKLYNSQVSTLIDFFVMTCSRPLHYQLMRLASCHFHSNIETGCNTKRLVKSSQVKGLKEIHGSKTYLLISFIEYYRNYWSIYY